jgi:ribosomal protein S18 acetylase RimI-like enzyme
MGLTYFKRFRMELDLSGVELTAPKISPAYHFVPWKRSLLEVHAEVKYQSFQDEIDAAVFPCFNDLAGCHRLMDEIVHRKGFVPESTWLAAVSGGSGEILDYCGTVQGIRDRSGMGAVQNLGIVPHHRGRQVGTVLMMLALEGFRKNNLNRVFLEVTANNVRAIRLYRRLGFRVVKTTYRAVEVAIT